VSADIVKGAGFRPVEAVNAEDHPMSILVTLSGRQVLWFGVTAHPTAEWIANQITQACGWEAGPLLSVRDRDRAYGEVFIRRVRSMSIRNRPTSPRSPWQNAYAERLIGSIRRECLDHVVGFGERHLRHVLLSYMNYYNETRTLVGQGCAPIAHGSEGRAYSSPSNPGGLHHQYIGFDLRQAQVHSRRARLPDS
jgi:transposase InsO family protein